ncbi:hypothetical protein C7476_11563 [Phyllobacterium bourgognense]|uniref:Uncharacterized protein n=1 Tax=Phyllobacterium bourgognense TaxID=314236 RepID=A0A368YKQ5_9HYPH|nr:hypothetical protein C7476_11563 [Phyllobacterium bourgognense]
MQCNGRLLLDAVTGDAIDMLNASASEHPNFSRSNSYHQNLPDGAGKDIPRPLSHMQMRSQKVSEVMLQSS